MKKKIGDWIHLYDDHFYQIQSVPEVFFNNRLATKEEIKNWKERIK